MNIEYKFKHHSRMAFMLDAIRRRKAGRKLSATTVGVIIWVIIACGMLFVPLIEKDRALGVADWAIMLAILMVIVALRYIIWIPALLFVTRKYPKNLEWSVARLPNGLMMISSRGGSVFVNSSTHKITKKRDTWQVECDEFPFAQFLIPSDKKSNELLKFAIASKGPPPMKLPAHP